MKKVLFVMRDLHGGGAEKALVNLLKICEKTTWSITVLLVKKEGVFLPDIPDNVNVMEIELPEDIRGEIFYTNLQLLQIYWGKKKYSYFLKMLLRLSIAKFRSVDEKMKSTYQRYDKRLPFFPDEFDTVIDFQGQGSFETYYVAKKTKAKRKISWIHNDFTVVREKCEWLKELYKQYDKIVSVAKQTEKEFLKKFPACADKSHYCYNVIPFEQIAKDSNSYEVKRKAGINVVTVGRLYYQKGYDIALKAFSRLKKEGFDFHYFMVGEGEERGFLENMISQLDLSDSVSVEGFRINPYPYMKMCDIYLQPSRFEGFCITLGEAKIFSKPIITTDFAGAREQIENGKTGIIIQCEEEEIYLNLKTLIMDAVLREKLGNSERSHDNSIEILNKVISLVEG